MKRTIIFTAACLIIGMGIGGLNYNGGMKAPEVKADKVFSVAQEGDKVIILPYGLHNSIS